MFKGNVVSIFIAPESGAPMKSVSEVRAVLGKGLEGDRFFYKDTGGNVTFFEMETLEAIKRDYNMELTPEETRRNIIVRDVPLNHLVDKEFKVGDVVFRGIKLSEPCGYLEKKAGKPVAKALIHRGGLEAEIITEGIIKNGDILTL